MIQEETKEQQMISELVQETIQQLIQQTIQENIYETNQEIVQEPESELQQLERQLKVFIQENTENYPQRSADWYRVRQFSFGGSELANLMGICHKSYMSQSDFFTDKFNAQQGTGKSFKQQQQMIMDWGTLFEPVHRMVLEDILCSQITEASMCRGKGILLGSHQSPDGLGVIPTDVFIKNIDISDIRDKTVFNSKYITVLFEQKCPYLRKIIPHTVPDHYIGQIKLGLSMFTPCQIACYSESLFRICTSRQWVTNTYNTHILIQRKPDNPDPEPLYIGMCEFDDIGKTAMGIESGELSGIMSQAHFMKIMDLTRLNSLQQKIHIYKYSEIETAKEKIKELQKNNKSYFSWKLVQLQHTAVERSQGFENVVSMYVNLGSRALTKFCQSQEKPIQELQDIQEFTAKVKQMGLPLVPGNYQDTWYLKYERSLLDLYEKYLLDDWQSFYVLLTLLSRSRDQQLRQRAVKFIERARKACEQCETKKEMLEHLISEVQVIDETRELNTC